jgi:hypothetical protein
VKFLLLKVVSSKLVTHALWVFFLSPQTISLSLLNDKEEEEGRRMGDVSRKEEMGGEKWKKKIRKNLVF